MKIPTQHSNSLSYMRKKYYYTSYSSYTDMKKE